METRSRDNADYYPKFGIARKSSCSGCPLTNWMPTNHDTRS
jgi:hypothetical protein